MKSGPTLKPCTRRPRLRNAAIIPVATVVLPTPLWVPERQCVECSLGVLTVRSCFQIEREPGDRQDHFISGLGCPLVQEPLGIAKRAGHGGFRNSSATEFIGNKNDVAVASRAGDPLKFGSRSIFH